jgi:6-phosphogluconate dehydrogenase
MELGIIGLGKMGFNMAARLLKEGHSIIAYNRTQEKVKELEKLGAKGAKTPEKLIEALTGNNEKKVIWLMVPQNVVDEMIEKILPNLEEGDILIDGGNSNFNLSRARYEKLKKKGISFMDIGVSGGLVASKLGYCMMAGGDKDSYETIEPLLKSMCVENGYGYMGPAGSGHFVKMVHNAIEYGMMEAIGEGFALLEKGPYADLNMKSIANVWSNGSIIRGFLMDMTKNAFEHNGNKLEKVPGFINDTGEGMWAVEEAMKHKVPFTINSHALFARYRSRESEPTANKLVAAIRDEFGGHGVGKK